MKRSILCRRAFAPAALTAFTLLSACGMFRSDPWEDQEPVVTGVGTSDLEDIQSAVAASEGEAAGLAVALEAIRTEIFTARSVATAGDSEFDPVRRAAMARASARRAALRGLMPQILVWNVPGAGRTLVEVISAEPDWRIRLEDFLSAECDVSVEESDAGIILEAWIKGSELYPVLAELVGADASLTPGRIQEHRTRVRTDAIRRARENLYAELLTTRAREGTLADIIRADSGARRELTALVNGLEPEKVEYDEAGGCTATVRLERSRVARYLKN